MQSLARSTLPAGLLRRCCCTSRPLFLPAAATCSTKRTERALFSSSANHEPPSSPEASASSDGDGLSTGAEGGGDHDDFWSSVKSAAESTPAYQNASSGVNDGYGSSTYQSPQPRGGFGGGRQLPAGQAYQTTTAPNIDQVYTPPPVFDMSHGTHLSPVRKVEVRSFNGRLLVDIRQHYKDAGGSIRPAAKGMALTVAQYTRLKAAIPIIDDMIRAHGEDPHGSEAPNFSS